MKKRSVKIGKHGSVPASLVLGLLAGMGTLVLGSAIIATLMQKETLGESAAGYGVIIVLIVAAYLECKVAYKWLGENRLMTLLLSGVLLFVVLLSLTALFFGGQYSGIGATGLMILCGCGLASLPVGADRRAGKRYKMKMKAR